MKFLKREYIIIIIAILFSASMFLFNDVNIEIRLQELKIFLQNSNLKKNNLDHISLIMKFQLGRRLYENTIKNEKADEIELRVNKILSDRIETQNVSINKYNTIAQPVLFTINFLRKLMGKSPIENIHSHGSCMYYELAYYYERNKNYDKAIMLYNLALQDTSIECKTRGSIQLHKGFCLSLHGDFEEAKKIYRKIIKNYQDSSISITAAILLNYIDTFKREISKVKKTKDSVLKGEKLFRLIAFKESLSVLERIETKTSTSDKNLLRYYKARCLEELSKKEEAIEIYQKIITESPSSVIAKNANRRIYVVGELNYSGSTITKLAESNNRMINDPSFEKMVQKNSQIPAKDTFRIKLSQNKEMNRVFNQIEKKDPEVSGKMIKTLRDKIKKSEGKIKTANSKESLIIKYKIFTIDGNVFVGSIKKETKDMIQLDSLLGNIKIRKQNILKKQKL